MLKKLLLRLEILIILGLLTAIWAFSNVVGITDNDSDIFWGLFGLGAALEGMIELWYGRKEDE
jgi:hypothetical protein